MKKTIPPPVYAPFRRTAPGVPPAVTQARLALPVRPPGLVAVQAKRVPVFPAPPAVAGLAARASSKRLQPAAPGRGIVQRAEQYLDWYSLRKEGGSYGGKHAFVSNASDEYSTKQANAFADEAHVRSPRSFAPDRVRQVLRWLATYLLNRFGGVEVQCYVDKDVIYISSNKDEVNTAMERARQSGSLLPAFAAPTSAVPSERVARHTWKLSRLPPSGNADEVALKTLLANNRLVIVPPDSTLLPGYHAERRIRALIGRPLSAERLAGTRRACMACATALNLGAHSHPGILYTSSAGLGGLAMDEVQDVAEQRQLSSHITKNRAGTLTDGYDTDSDDDSY
ncbi:MAG: hypothetical protein ACJ8GW_07605 [Massilia sp.]